MAPNKKPAAGHFDVVREFVQDKNIDAWPRYLFSFQTPLLWALSPQPFRCRPKNRSMASMLARAREWAVRVTTTAAPPAVPVVSAPLVRMDRPPALVAGGRATGAALLEEAVGECAATRRACVAEGRGGVISPNTICHFSGPVAAFHPLHLCLGWGFRFFFHSRRILVGSIHTCLSLFCLLWPYSVLLPACV